jgi:hypothetical protein
MQNLKVKNNFRKFIVKDKPTNGEFSPCNVYLTQKIQDSAKIILIRELAPQMSGQTIKFISV